MRATSAGSSTPSRPPASTPSSAPGRTSAPSGTNGGLPVWLTRSGVRVRTDDPGYLEAVDEFLAAVYDVVRPRQADRGGPVVLVQVENEYGAYPTGTDAARARRAPAPPRRRDPGGGHHRAAHHRRPADRRDARCGHPARPPHDRVVRRPCGRTARDVAPPPAGGPAGVLGVLDRVVRPLGFAPRDDVRGRGHRRTGGDALPRGRGQRLHVPRRDELRVHQRRERQGHYQPTITSYDYDALLDEAGRPTAKYHAFREVLARHAPVPPPAVEVAPAAAAPELRSRFSAARPPLASLPPGPELSWTGTEPPVLDDLEIGSGRSSGSPGSAGPPAVQPLRRCSRSGRSVTG